jgi:hypothetical protein
MTTTNPPPPTGAPSTPHAANAAATDPGAWTYNDSLRVIVHAPQSCETCSDWALHYTLSSLSADASLREAEAQRTTAIRASAETELSSLRDMAETLRRDAGVLRDELARARSDADLTRRQLDEANSEIHRLHDVHDDMERRADNTIDDLRNQIDDLYDRIRELERGNTPRRRKAPRRGSQSASPSRSSRPSARSPRHASPMSEDRSQTAVSRDPSQPPLLRRITRPSPAASSPGLLTPVELPPQSTSPSPMSDGRLLSRIADDVLAATQPTFAATSIAPIVGFPSLLPVLYQAENRVLTAAPGTTILTGDGSVDLTAFPRYVLVIGGWIDGEPSWLTSLVRSEQMQTPAMRAAIEATFILPLSGIVTGGRNGVLISPHTDPNSEAAVEELLTNVRRHAHAVAYIDRVQYTPPELRDPIHQRALERWPGIKAERRQQNQGFSTREPRPAATTYVWKKWLQTMRKVNPAFTYVGIPVSEPGRGPGYQVAHIDGTRALLAFLPLNSRGAVTSGPIRDAFLRAASALLSVPERYSQVLAQLGLTIDAQRRTILYSEAQYGAAEALGINEVTRFLAATGVTTAEAEQWRAWATAYLEMDLERSPNGPRAELLRNAKQRARAIIDGNPQWILKNVHTNVPGNYNPGLERARAGRAQLPQAEAGSSSITVADPSTAAPAYTHPDDAGGTDTHLGYGDVEGEDTSMGPA